jgi:hypothetical protein
MNDSDDAINIVATAQKEYGGTVLSAAPMIRDRKSVFGVIMADKGKITEFHYGVPDGKLLSAGR